MIDFSKDDAAFVRFAHYKENFDDGDVLHFTNRAGAGRVVETQHVYKNHSDIPKELAA